MIPGSTKPTWSCRINNIDYEYPAATMQTVPDEVAELIRDNYGMNPKESLKIDASGTNIINFGKNEKFNSNAGNILIHEMLGNTIQDGTPSPTSPVDMKSVKVDVTTRTKNIIPFPYFQNNITTNGITFTTLSDGSILANGTATGNAQLRLLEYSVDNSNLLECGKKYRVSGMPEEIPDSNTTVYMMFAVFGGKNGTDIKARQYLYSSRVNYFLDLTNVTNFYNVYAFIMVLPGQTLNNVKFKPMIEEVKENGSYTKDFVKGENSEANTSIVLRSIGDVKDKLFFEDGKFLVERRIKEVKLSDVQSTVFESTENDGEDTKCYRWELDRFNSPNGTRDALCNVNEISLNTNDIKSGKGSVITNGNVLYGYLSIPNTITTTDDANEFVADNNVSVIYKTDAPIIEEVSTDDAIKLLSLMSFDGETNISVESDSATIEYGETRTAALALSAFCTSKCNEVKIDSLNGIMLASMI